MKLNLKQFGRRLLLLILCFNCLNASVGNEKIEELLLKQIDEERMAYKLYDKLNKAYPEIKVFKSMKAVKKQDFSTLTNYAKIHHPDLKIGALTGLFKVRETEKLYKKLLKQGKASSANAVDVGIELEKTDIENIAYFLKSDPESELVDILEELKGSSQNHLAKFRREKTRM